MRRLEWWKFPHRPYTQIMIRYLSPSVYVKTSDDGNSIQEESVRK